MSNKNRFFLVITGLLIVIAGLLLTLLKPEQYTRHSFDRIDLSEQFFAEGAGIGDLNSDDNLDVICGPYWYEGPELRTRHAFYEPVPFDPLVYSDNFVVAVEDVNNDTLNDILIVGFPGEAAFWYENPGSPFASSEWPRHLIHPGVDNESPTFFDLDGDGRLELLFHTEGVLGFAESDPANPYDTWTFHPVSAPGGWGNFKHGFGVGDLSGDGNPDFMMSEGWWENPGESSEGELWTFHEVDFGPGGAQMYAYDVDDDGLNDVITSLAAHGWGLAWYKQVPGDTGMEFEQHLIMGEEIGDNPFGVRFSQPHAVELADLDRDGVMDIVSGKRYWAHGPDGDFEPNAAAVVYWFQLIRTEDGADFIPFLIDDDSGVGTQFTSGDITGNGLPDVVTCNKNGGHVFLNSSAVVSEDEWKAGWPERF